MSKKLKHYLSALITTLTFAVISSPANAVSLCTLASPHFNPNTDQQPGPLADQQMAEVNQVLCAQFGCPFYQLWSNTNAGNAMATTDQNGSTIRYNPNFMNNTIASYGPMATSGILAHELGHLIDFSNRRGNFSSGNREAEADKYAGCAFALAGNPSSDLSALAASLHSMGSSPGYPTASQRVQLVLIGYNMCRN